MGKDFDLNEYIIQLKDKAHKRYETEVSRLEESIFKTGTPLDKENFIKLSLNQLKRVNTINWIETIDSPAPIINIHFYLNGNDNETINKIIQEIIDGVNSKYTENDFIDAFYERNLFQYLDRKLNIPDFHIYQTKDEIKTKLTHQQKVLALEYLGFLSFLENQGLNQKNMASVVSSIIGLNYANTISYIRYNGKFSVKKHNNYMKSKENIKIIVDLFNNLGLEKQALTAKKDLLTIERKEIGKIKE